MPQLASNISTDSGLFMLFKGAPKEGKSVAAASFPNSYTLDFDNKIVDALHWARRHPDYPQDFAYDTFDDLIEVQKTLENFKLSCPYETIIVDGITEAANLAMNCMIKYREPDWRNSGKTKSTTTSKTVRAGVPMSEIEDFNGESRFLTSMVDDLRVINIKHHTNIIVLAHVVTDTFTDTAGRVVRTTKRIITQGNKVGAALPGKFSHVFHFERESAIISSDKPHFLCYTQDVNGNGAGTSLDIPGVIDCTDKHFYNLLMMKIRKEIF
jgi:hypothetical protein